jgi:hypothetical protein
MNSGPLRSKLHTKYEQKSRFLSRNGNNEGLGKSYQQPLVLYEFKASQGEEVECKAFL